MAVVGTQVCVPGGLCADPSTFGVSPQNQSGVGVHVNEPGPETARNPSVRVAVLRLPEFGREGRPGRAGLTFVSLARSIGARNCVTSLSVSNVYLGLNVEQKLHTTHRVE